MSPAAPGSRTPRASRPGRANPARRPFTVTDAVVIAVPSLITVECVSGRRTHDEADRHRLLDHAELGDADRVGDGGLTARGRLRQPGSPPPLTVAVLTACPTAIGVTGRTKVAAALTPAPRGSCTSRCFPAARSSRASRRGERRGDEVGDGGDRRRGQRPVVDHRERVARRGADHEAGRRRRLRRSGGPAARSVSSRWRSCWSRSGSTTSIWRADRRGVHDRPRGGRSDHRGDRVDGRRSLGDRHGIVDRAAAGGRAGGAGAWRACPGREGRARRLGIGERRPGDVEGSGVCDRDRVGERASGATAGALAVFCTLRSALARRRQRGRDLARIGHSLRRGDRARGQDVHQGSHGRGRHVGLQLALGARRDRASATRTASWLRRPPPRCRCNPCR